MTFRFLNCAASAAVCLGLGVGTFASPALAQTSCRNTGEFGAWMSGFRKEAAAKGISQRTISAALNGIEFDPSIIRRDRGQSFFTQSFLDFQRKLATQNRIRSGKAMIRKHEALFRKVEAEFGVPPSVITGFWALESDFGAGLGKLSVLRSLATLAYDCRRGEMFRNELFEALRIIDRGDLRPSDMIGSWAGELGQTQFLPRLYNQYGLDYDGDGRRDLFKSIPDIVASSANYIRAMGWKRGELWLDEVRVPQRLDWKQSSLEIEHPRRQWAQWGVQRADGRPLPDDDKPASLLLMMGRNGPAFMAYRNFRVYTEWNKSLNYAVTAAYLATRIDGAREMSKGRAEVEVLDRNDLRQLQQLLTKRGYEVGEIDGKLGSMTRSAVRAAQIKLGLAADSYPSRELIHRLRQGG
ncbi:MAG: lytic murein transglycosylase [Hyphomicrobiaceae bacterium]